MNPQSINRSSDHSTLLVCLPYPAIGIYHADDNLIPILEVTQVFEGINQPPTRLTKVIIVRQVRGVEFLLVVGIGDVWILQSEFEKGLRPGAPRETVILPAIDTLAGCTLIHLRQAKAEDL